MRATRFGQRIVDGSLFGTLKKQAAEYLRDPQIPDFIPAVGYLDDVAVIHVGDEDGPVRPRRIPHVGVSTSTSGADSSV